MTVVQKYGQLRVAGNKIVDQSGTPIQLRGMSLFWSQWVPKYYNYNTIKWLRDDWKITVIRAAVGINGTGDGYLANPTAEKNKVIAVVDAAIQLGIYVIIDWHDHDEHRAQAKAFFIEMAQRYGNSPNVIYEPWNEPKDPYSWANTIKPYNQEIIAAIRQYDADNLILCGNAYWSQRVDEAAANPVSGSNIAYTLHFYSGYVGHREELRARAATALNLGAAIFVTEYGLTDYTGNGAIDEAAVNDWWDFLDLNKISYVNWSLADLSETSAALVPGASVNGGWAINQIKPSGQLVRAKMIAAASGGGGTTPSIANGTYRLIARNSGKVLDVAGSSTADGSNIQQNSNVNATNQQWIVQSLSTDVYSIRAVHSGKSMDVSGNSTADGGDINQWTYSGGNNQRWKIESVGSGYYRIVSVSSGKAVEITGNATSNGAGINQRTYNGATNQQFTFQPLVSATTYQPFIANSSIGNQNALGEQGMDFRVNASTGIVITQLGAFDHRRDGLNGTQPNGSGGMGIRVAIFNKATRAIVPGLDAVIVGNGDAFAGYYRYKNIPAVTLPPGDYLVLAKGYNANELSGNSYVGGGPYTQGDNAGGAITFLNTVYYDENDAVPGFTYPSVSFNTGTSSILRSGTFTYAVNQGSQPTATTNQPFIANSSVGNQNPLGEQGMDFRVNATGGIIISQLGAFDHQANGLIGTQSNGSGGSGIRVAIFNKATRAIVPGLDAVITGNGDAFVGNYRYKNITAVTLPPGDYLLLAKGYNANELSGNSYLGGGPYPQGNNAGGAITFLNSVYYDDNDAVPGFTYPSVSVNTGTSSVLKSGNFTFALNQSNQAMALAPLAAAPAAEGIISSTEQPAAKSEGPKLDVYPNPSNGSFNVQLSGFSGPQISLEITDGNGKVIVVKAIRPASKTPVLTVPFNLSNKASGMYWIRAVSADGVKTAKGVIEAKLIKN